MAAMLLSVLNSFRDQSHFKIVVLYYDEHWNLHKEQFSGYAARIIQHEFDHIEGVLFTDHLNPLKKKLIQKKLKQIADGTISTEYKMKFYKLKR